MTKKALVVGSVAATVMEASAVDASFHPEIAAQFVPVPGGVEVGWRQDEEGAWSPPPEAPSVTGPGIPPDAYVVDVPTFKMRFTPQQLVAIRASEDQIVKAFLSEVLDDLRTINVNLALPFVQQAVGYLAEVDLIAPADIEAILAPST